MADSMLAFASLFVIVVAVKAAEVARLRQHEPPPVVERFRKEVGPLLEEDRVTVQTSFAEAKLVYSEGLLFETCQWELSEAGMAMLRRHGELINPLVGGISEIRIIGHADSRSPANCKGLRRGDNWELSSLRAFSVRDLMLQMTGIDSTLVIPVPKSSLDPIVPERPADPQNRRIEIVMKFTEVREL